MQNYFSRYLSNFFFFLMISINFLLSGCGCWPPERMFRPMETATVPAECPKEAVCNELRTRILLNAATSDTRIANMQRSEKYLQMKNFEQCCQ